MILYPDLQHIIAMHDVMIKRFGGIKGLRDQHLLESAVSQPAQNVFGEELFPDVPSKSAAYAYYISENQPFLDGNKRTAVATALTFLRLNGYDLKIPVAEANKVLYDTIMRVANRQMTRDELIEWFRKNSRRRRKK